MKREKEGRKKKKNKSNLGVKSMTKCQLSCVTMQARIQSFDNMLAFVISNWMEE